MLHTKFRENQSAGSRGEDFLKGFIRNRSVWPTLFFLNVFTALKGTHLFIFTMYGHGGHLGHVTSIILMDFYFHVPKGLHTNFG